MAFNWRSQTHSLAQWKEEWKELVWRRGADSHGDRGRGREKGREQRGRMSETLVPEAWAEAFSCWCQNVFLRACGQTEIKGNRAAEWHHTHTHTHTHAHTQFNGLSQFGFIMSQLFNVSNPHNAVWLNKQHTLPSGMEVKSERKKRGEEREVKKALATPLCPFQRCQGCRKRFPYVLWIHYIDFMVNCSLFFQHNPYGDFSFLHSLSFFLFFSSSFSNFCHFCFTSFDQLMK